MKPEDVKPWIDSIGNALAPLAAKLGLASQKLFAYFVRQNYTYAIEDVIFFILSFGIIILCLRGWLHIYGCAKEQCEHPFCLSDGSYLYEGAIARRIVSAILICIFCIALWFAGTKALERFTLPELNAIKDILNTLKP